MARVHACHVIVWPLISENMIRPYEYGSWFMWCIISNGCENECETVRLCYTITIPGPIHQVAKWHSQR